MKRAACLAAAAIAICVQLRAQATASDAASIQFALERLNTSGSALMIAAHPDDENTALLAWLARGRKVRTGYLSLTRGEGGQNLIGPEQGSLLGVIRTQELLAARKIDGAEQFFTSAVDFGFSKSAEETLTKWDRNRILGEIVQVIRTFQPDVIILRFSGTPRDGHGQHQASAILGKEAFEAAADPQKYPEQLQKLKPWRARRLLWNAFAFTPQQRKQTEAIPDKLPVDVGEFDSLLGRSYAEVAGASRSMHQSQAMGTQQRRGSSREYLVHVAGERATKDLFDGVPSSSSPTLAEAIRAFDWHNPDRTIPLLAKARNELKDERKRHDLDETLAACAGLWLDASFDKPVATLGESVRIRTTAVNRSRTAMVLKAVNFEIPNPPSEVINKPLEYNVPVTQEVAWTVMQPDRDPIAWIQLTIAGVPVILNRPIIHRYVDDLRGELTRPFTVVPAVAVRYASPSMLFPSQITRTVELNLRAFAAASGTARLSLPDGWQSEPATAPFKLTSGNESVVRFRVTPPRGATIADARASVEVDGKASDVAVDIIDHSHIPVQVIKTEAKSTLTRTDVITLAKHIGYVTGAGDLIPGALRQLDCDITLLTPEALKTGDLSRFDAIVTGVRAYSVRPDLRANGQRLMDYVRNGGTLVVQYNSLQGDDTFELAPYPFKVTRFRVSVEEAPVQLLLPQHPVLQLPNKITAGDFSGWVQERGLYFAGSWDKQYETPLAAADPGEKPSAGGLLYTRFGKGVYIFTAYSWFRQLPAGVPGAYRIFANLLSAGQALSKQ